MLMVSKIIFQRDEATHKKGPCSLFLHRGSNFLILFDMNLIFSTRLMDVYIWEHKNIPMWERIAIGISINFQKAHFQDHLNEGVDSVLCSSFFITVK